MSHRNQGLLPNFPYRSCWVITSVNNLRPKYRRGVTFMVSWIAHTLLKMHTYSCTCLLLHASLDVVLSLPCYIPHFWHMHYTVLVWSWPYLVVSSFTPCLLYIRSYFRFAFVLDCVEDLNPHKLSCPGSSLGWVSARLNCRGFESHPRQLFLFSWKLCCLLCLCFATLCNCPAQFTLPYSNYEVCHHLDLSPCLLSYIVCSW